MSRAQMPATTRPRPRRRGARVLERLRIQQLLLEEQRFGHDGTYPAVAAENLVGPIRSPCRERVDSSRGSQIRRKVACQAWLKHVLGQRRRDARTIWSDVRRSRGRCWERNESSTLHRAAFVLVVQATHVRDRHDRTGRRRDGREMGESLLSDRCVRDFKSYSM